MMSKSHAIKVAEDHLESLPAPPSYRWILTQPIRVEGGWVFEYEYECVDGSPPEEWDPLGGAPGFIVLDDTSLEVLSWDELRALRSGGTCSDDHGRQPAHHAAQEETMTNEAIPGITCQVTAYYLQDPPDDGVTGPHPWLAVATAHMYDPHPATGAALTPDGQILAGVTMRTFEGKTTALTQQQAVQSAVAALFARLEASGLCGAHWFTP
jgi:hypothetical protein